jgi:hypothetical protein
MTNEPAETFCAVDGGDCPLLGGSVCGRKLGKLHRLCVRIFFTTRRDMGAYRLTIFQLDVGFSLQPVLGYRYSSDYLIKRGVGFIVNSSSVFEDFGGRFVE